MSKEQDLEDKDKALHIALVSGCTIETGSLNEPYDGDTDGCYLCKFGNYFGCDESDVCRTCELELHQYYR